MVFRLMKNTFIVVTIILLLIVVFLIIAMFIGSRPIKSNYYNQVDAVGMIEKKYTNRGEYEVESIKANSNEELFKEYKIWYPLELEERLINISSCFVSKWDRGSLYKVWCNI